MLLGHFSNNRLGTGVDHNLLGWLIFGAAMFGMFAVGMRWSDRERDPVPLPVQRDRAQKVPNQAIATMLLGALMAAAVGAAALVLYVFPSESYIFLPNRAHHRPQLLRRGLHLRRGCRQLLVVLLPLASFLSLHVMTSAGGLVRPEENPIDESVMMTRVPCWPWNVNSTEPTS